MNTRGSKYGRATRRELQEVELRPPNPEKQEPEVGRGQQDGMLTKTWLSATGGMKACGSINGYKASPWKSVRDIKQNVHSGG